MENTSYALFIAVGTLIAIGLISLIVFNWRKMGSFEKAKDDVVDIENRAKFNAEFEAYNRGLMYGTDVLSCLNKAQNNNQRYVYNNYFGTDTENFGKDDRKEFFVDVSVKILSPLYENIKAYYKDETGKFQRVIGLDDEENYDIKIIKAGTNVAINDPDVDYYYFKDGLVYQETKKYSDIMWTGVPNSKTKLASILKDSGQIETDIKKGTYHLLTNYDDSDVSKEGKPDSTEEDKYDTAKLSALISTVTLTTQKIVNPETPTAFDGSDWWYYSWETAASDFKSRKFKCVGAEYSKTTGYINKLEFEEIER